MVMPMMGKQFKKLTAMHVCRSIIICMRIDQKMANNITVNVTTYVMLLKSTSHIKKNTKNCSKVFDNVQI